MVLRYGQATEGLSRCCELGIARLSGWPSPVPQRVVINLGGSLNFRILFFSRVIFPLLTAGPWASGPWLRRGREGTSSDPPWGSPHLTPPPQVLETCMKSCGKRFHDEVGKFRFLNELIKVVSPKVGAPSARSDLCCQMAVEEG